MSRSGIDRRRAERARRRRFRRGVAGAVVMAMFAVAGAATLSGGTDGDTNVEVATAPFVEPGPAPLSSTPPSALADISFLRAIPDCVGGGCSLLLRKDDERSSDGAATLGLVRLSSTRLKLFLISNTGKVIFSGPSNGYPSSDVPDGLFRSDRSGNVLLKLRTGPYTEYTVILRITPDGVTDFGSIGTDRPGPGTDDFHPGRFFPTTSISDVDGDGLLDIFVGLSTARPNFAEGTALQYSWNGTDYVAEHCEWKRSDSPPITVPVSGCDPSLRAMFTRGPKAITFGNITFYAPTYWSGPAEIRGNSAVVGTLAGGRQSVNLLVITNYTDSIDALVPTVCNEFPVERPLSVEVTESGFRPVGDRTAEFRLWTSTCPTRGLEVHRAWLLPASRIAIYEQTAEGHPENVAVVATAEVR